VIGPPSPDIVPIAELPEHVLRAVTSSEDAGFFAHPGFDFDELRNAAVQGAERGRVVRGGSTITQQVAKNLFLDGERTFARKVREAAIEIGLEATLPKRRILEIYLNVAEWGPGVWGIGPAARHWFGKDARALTPKEAAFLASVIPSPLRSQAMLERGAPTEARELRVRDILFHMAEQGALSEDRLVDALIEPVVLASTTRAHDPSSFDPDASDSLGDRGARTP
jgi:membrane peptidoglycan carboxypeptidase